MRCEKLAKFGECIRTGRSIVRKYFDYKSQEARAVALNFMKILKLIFPKWLIEFIGRHREAELAWRVNRRFSGTSGLDQVVDAQFSDYERLRRFREAEHQIGRFLNMKKVFAEVNNLGLSGDVVEFGSWRGYGLVLLDQAIGVKTCRHLVGIDSFEGLPDSSTIRTKQALKETSINAVDKFVSSRLANFERHCLIKGWFNESRVKNELLANVKSVSVVHFDADLGSSTSEALRLIEPYLKDRMEPIFFLFDDWGCHPDEVPDAFNNWAKLSAKKFGFQIERVASTNLTRYLKLVFGK